ncbi:hypothetical protein L226DRAFT_73628 [Lentinus tigrinus ALCF2SS1-7]|uniref:uncharacterized protein n=1 Tax=Lentinus tigrinus ALCF2SS1-7 TaxID=1328758 RepID=UPI0011662E17|nr:hypothetical protein L226DRAFT_73628 [Lentinus tigrinus ALCF2SS1-7]
MPTRRSAHEPTRRVTSTVLRASAPQSHCPHPVSPLPPPPRVSLLAQLVPALLPAPARVPQHPPIHDSSLTAPRCALRLATDPTALSPSRQNSTFNFAFILRARCSARARNHLLGLTDNYVRYTKVLATY